MILCKVVVGICVIWPGASCPSTGAVRSCASRAGPAMRLVPVSPEHAPRCRKIVSASEAYQSEVHMTYNGPAYKTQIGA